MDPADVKRVGVVGCGIMGSGIVEVCAAAGAEVTFVEVSDDRVAAGRAAIERSLATAVDRGKLEAGRRDEMLDRISGTRSREDLAGVDLAIEAVSEDLDTKLEVFRDLDRITREEIVLATNTSSMPIIQLAVATRRPDRVVGMHFFNPPPVMKLLEVVPALTTSEETLAFAQAYAASLGKSAVVAGDRAGFIVNRLLTAYLNAAVRMLEEGFASREDIDTAVKLGLRHPMGPFELLDFIGLDTMVAVADVLYDEFLDPLYAAPPLARRMVQAGWHGRKTGRGFYDYGDR